MNEAIKELMLVPGYFNDYLSLKYPGKLSDIKLKLRTLKCAYAP